MRIKSLNTALAVIPDDRGSATTKGDPESTTMVSKSLAESKKDWQEW